MYQESMDPSVPVFKGVQDHKAVGDRRCVNDRRNVSGFHPFVGFEQAGHQAGNVFVLWADETYHLLFEGYCFPDVILDVTIIAFLNLGSTIRFRSSISLSLSQKSSFSASSRAAMNFSVRDALGLICSISKDDFVSLL
jgi:hypothetical protein